MNNCNCPPEMGCHEAKCFSRSSTALPCGCDVQRPGGTVLCMGAVRLWGAWGSQHSSQGASLRFHAHTSVWPWELGS